MIVDQDSIQTDPSINFKSSRSSNRTNSNPNQSNRKKNQRPSSTSNSRRGSEAGLPINNSTPTDCPNCSNSKHSNQVHQKCQTGTGQEENLKPKNSKSELGVSIESESSLIFGISILIGFISLILTFSSYRNSTSKGVDNSSNSILSDSLSSSELFESISSSSSSSSSSSQPQEKGFFPPFLFSLISVPTMSFFRALSYLNPSSYSSIKNDGLAMDPNHSLDQNWFPRLINWFRGMARMETVLLFLVCFFTLSFLAYWTNPTEASFRTYLTDSSLRQSLRQLETDSSTPLKPRSTTSTSDDELEQQLSSNPTSRSKSSSSSSNPSLTFAHKISLSLKTPPYVRRDGKFYTVVTVKHAKRNRGGGSLTFPNRLSKSKDLNGEIYQCSECGFSEANDPEVVDDWERMGNHRHPHEHVSWYLGAFGTWWLVAQGWEISSPPLPAPLTGGPSWLHKETKSHFMDSASPWKEIDPPGTNHPLSSSHPLNIGKKKEEYGLGELEKIRIKERNEKLEFLEQKEKEIDYGVFEIRSLNDDDQKDSTAANQKKGSKKQSNRSGSNANQSQNRNNNSPSLNNSIPNPSSNPNAPSSTSKRKKAKAKNKAAQNHTQNALEDPNSHHDKFLPDSLARDLTQSSSHSNSANATSRQLPSDPNSAQEISKTKHLDDPNSAVSIAKATNLDLEAQLLSLQETSSNTKSQLNSQLEALRTRKKEEDVSRSEIKTKMKSLDESKRQAEGVKKEAERKLKNIEGVKNSLKSKIDGHRKEMKLIVERRETKERGLKDQGKMDEQEEKEVEELEKQRTEKTENEELEMKQLEDDLSALEGKFQEQQANLEAAKILALERRHQAQAEAMAHAKAQAEVRAAQAQARAIAKAQSQQQALMNPNLLPSQAGPSSHMYPLLSGPGDFASNPYDHSWANSNQTQRAPLAVGAGASFLSPLDLSSARNIPIQDPRLATSGGAFSPPPNSPFYTDLLPSNLFASTDEDDDDLRGVFPGRERSATLESALGRFGLASEDEGGETPDQDLEEEDSFFNLSKDDLSRQDRGIEETDSFSDANGDETVAQEIEDSFADAPSSQLASPVQVESPNQDPDTPVANESSKSEEPIQAEAEDQSNFSPEEAEQPTTSSLSRTRRPSSKGSAGRTWWGKSRSESVARSDVTAEAGDNDSEQKEEKTTEKGENLERRKSRTFSVLPKLSLNPSAKAFKSSSRSTSRPTIPERSPVQDYPIGGYPNEGRVPSGSRLGSGGWNGAQPAPPVVAPISDYEAVRRAFEANKFPLEDEDEQGRRSWSAFDSWQAHQGGQGPNSTRPYLSQHPSPLVGGRAHPFNGGPTDWNPNPRSSSDSLPYSNLGRPQQAFGNGFMGGGPGFSRHHHNGSLSRLSSGSGFQRNGNQEQPGLSAGRDSWLSSDDELFNPLARSISAGDVSSTSLASTSLSINSSSGTGEARSRFAFWNRKANNSSSGNIEAEDKEKDKAVSTSASSSDNKDESNVQDSLRSGSDALPPQTPVLQIGFNSGSGSQEATPTQSQTPSKKRQFRWSRRADSVSVVSEAE